MPEQKIGKGGWLTYRFRIVRYHPDTGVTVEWSDGKRNTIDDDDAGIESVEPGPKKGSAE
jgi:hypothetical protein